MLYAIFVQLLNYQNFLMSNKVKSGLFFGIAMTVFFMSETVIAWITGTEQATNEISKSVFAALLAGLVSGLLFGWFTDRYLVFALFIKSPKFDVHNNETLMLQKPANHFKGAGSVGGHLCLTDKRLRFKSQGINTQSEECTINLSDISHVNTFKTLGLVNNGIEIITNEQVVERFVVDKQKHWLQSINQIKRHTTMGFAQVGQTE